MLYRDFVRPVASATWTQVRVDRDSGSRRDRGRKPENESRAGKRKQSPSLEAFEDEGKASGNKLDLLL